MTQLDGTGQMAKIIRQMAPTTEISKA